MGSRRRRAPRSSVNSTQKRHFPLGELSKERSAVQQKLLSKSKELNSLKKKLQRLQENISKTQTELRHLEENVSPTSTPQNSARGLAFQVSRNASTARKKSPTQLFEDGNVNLPRRSAHRRKLETLLASAEINGGSVENRGPALDGMFTTLVKYGQKEYFERYIDLPGKFRRAAINKVKNEVKQYEESEENFIRSLSLLYAGGVIGKAKYEQARSALVMRNTGKQTSKGYLSKERIKFGFGIPIPRPLAYSSPMKNVEQIDIGHLISLRETLCVSFPDLKKIDGQYRNLENLLIVLSKFYLETDQVRKPNDKLVWFGEREGSVKVAIGGDGAPFGKWDESMSWLVSFLNIGSRVASPNDNFLLFGANCKEDHDVVKLFAKQLVQEIKVIEDKT